MMLINSMKYLRVEKSNLNRIEKGSYISTATKSVGAQLPHCEVSRT